jgi:arylsulfatase A-like enzyme
MFDDLRPELSIYGKYHMITPNFERLAKRSVVFDHAYAQISVCNPSRDALLTGLRPDTVGTYGFQSSYSTYNNHMIIPTKLKRAGYRTVGLGKTRHWDGEDPDIWDRAWDNKWYDYQAMEWNFMKSSVMPDKNMSEELFPDHLFATRAIQELNRLVRQESDKYFMLSVGFKMPHTAMHVPYKYYDMYRGRSHAFTATPEQLQFPPTAPLVSWRCCAEHDWRYMNQEGAERANESATIQLVKQPFPQRAYKEAAWGYAALITFVDKQLGRVLDAVDELRLWDNLTIILTADHGMHNGEKGIWEKWSLFDESTHVPLIVHHPQSPFKGQRYPYPVELIDVFPTVNDILGVRFDRKKLYHADPRDPRSARKFIPLQGKSLAPVVLGRDFKFRSKRSTHFVTYRGDQMPHLNRTFAITQTWRCAPLSDHLKDPRKSGELGNVQRDFKPWDCCNVDDKPDWIAKQVSVMGYAMRTPDYRYVMYIHVLRPHRLPQFDKPLYAEELYDHRGDTESDLGKRELVNLASEPAFQDVVKAHRAQLMAFLYNEVVYVNISSTFFERETGKHKRKAKGWLGMG